MPRRAQVSRADYVSAAFEISARSGMQSLTLKALGEHLGLDATAVYRHFRNKDMLLRAMLDQLLQGVLEHAAPSDDPAEDGYVYGYRLWQAKQYDKAITELRTVVQKYPKHRRASYSQNLLGRALLDQGKPALAATAFFESYQKMPNGERAPDSLYYLAQSLVKMKKPASEVCKVYDELSQVYGDRISDAMKKDVATGRTASKCK